MIQHLGFVDFASMRASKREIRKRGDKFTFSHFLYTFNDANKITSFIQVLNLKHMKIVEVNIHYQTFHI